MPLKIAVDALVIFLKITWVVIYDSNFPKFLSLEYHIPFLLVFF